MNYILKGALEGAGGALLGCLAGYMFNFIYRLITKHTPGRTSR